MEKELISVITPCFNTADYLPRLLDSILLQTYPNVEMIAVDDGSTDNTSAVIKEYIPMFERRGYCLTYVYQENSGQSVAINRALKMVKGKYLVWPDSDDYYNSENALSRMVDALQTASDDFAMVRTQENLVEDGSLRVIDIWGKSASKYELTSLFRDCLFGRNGFYFCPGAYMIDFYKFKKVAGTNIYTDKDAGQNWQMMLPILYHFRCITILEPLYNVVVRQSSHSRGQYKGYEAIEKKYKSYENTLLNTLHRIDMPTKERNELIELIRLKYLHIYLNLCVKYKKKDMYDVFYLKIKEMGYQSSKEKLCHNSIIFYLVIPLCDFFLKTKRLLSRLLLTYLPSVYSILKKLK